jgi:uncharacterized membrane protein SpoIIM required for sporulation
MDLDGYVAAHRGEWEELDRLATLSRRPRSMSAVELDRLVSLYQRVAAQLSFVRSTFPDPALVDRLSGLVTRGRAAVTGSRDPSWREVARFLTVTFPAAVYVRRWWALGAAVSSIVVALALGVWLAHDPTLQAALLPPAQVRDLVDHQFSAYYRSAPAGAFAAKVWTNNVVVSGEALVLGVAFGVPTVFVLLENAVNVGASGGYLAAYGRTGEFFQLILPHGMLELTTVFVAAAAGLRLGWRLIDPGQLPRGRALAEEGRGAVTIALGAIATLACSGVLEAFVTPSPLPAWARIGLGGLAEAGFLALVIVRGGRAVRAGVTGGLDPELEGDARPVV